MYMQTTNEQTWVLAPQAGLDSHKIQHELVAAEVHIKGACSWCQLRRGTFGRWRRCTSALRGVRCLSGLKGCCCQGAPTLEDNCHTVPEAHSWSRLCGRRMAVVSCGTVVLQGGPVHLWWRVRSSCRVLAAAACATPPTKTAAVHCVKTLPATQHMGFQHHDAALPLH